MAIRQVQQRRPELPAILLTGFATATAELAATSLSGSFSLLHKPVAEQQRCEHVGMLLEGMPVLSGE